MSVCINDGCLSMSVCVYMDVCFCECLYLSVCGCGFASVAVCVSRRVLASKCKSCVADQCYCLHFIPLSLLNGISLCVHR